MIVWREGEGQMDVKKELGQKQQNLLWGGSNTEGWHKGVSSTVL